MLLAASLNDKIEVLSPQDDSKPGDKVYVEGYEGAPDDVLNPKKKVFETVQADLLTSAQCVPAYKGVPLRTAAGELKATTLAAATIR
ncbi:hypothetical protein EMCRGX_G034927 [Ephydatia muelleri]|eukprot:Em0023g800a